MSVRTIVWNLFLHKILNLRFVKEIKKKLLERKTSLLHTEVYKDSLEKYIFSSVVWYRVINVELSFQTVWFKVSKNCIFSHRFGCLHILSAHLYIENRSDRLQLCYNRCLNFYCK